MKNTKYFIQCFIIITLLINCKNDKNIFSENTIKHLVFPSSGDVDLKTSFFADTVMYVRLETIKESYIRNILQIWMNDTVILINDLQGKLLMFSRNGNFIRQVGKNGHGPGEYTRINHFEVINDTIYISSSGVRGILRYNFDGTFCDKIDLNYTLVYFNSTYDNKLACYNLFEGEIYIYNKDFYAPDTIVVEYGVTDTRYRYGEMKFPFKDYLQKTQSGLLFNSYRSDTIWNIRDNTKEPAYILDLKDQLLPYKSQVEFCNGDFEKWVETASIYDFVYLIPFQAFTFIFQLQWTTDTYNAIYLYSTKTGEIRKFNTSYIYDDIVGKQKLSNARLEFFYPLYSNDFLVTTINPSDVIEYLNQYEIKDPPSNSWINLMKNIKDDENPILVLIKVKKQFDQLE
jgi:hypothetical protein